MQKKLKTLGMVLLAFTLTTAVGVSVNTETASAKKVNAKKLTLKKKKLSMKVGDKKTLKVTVKPKKATLKWKSSKKKIATVSKKGVVKGKKKGTAKITVTSGKKKATCKVTVKQVFNINAVEVVNSKVVRVTLNKAKKLTASDFAVAKKANSDAKSSKKLTIASVNNSKNKVYELVLATNYDAEYDDNAISDEDYVSVTIKKLNGLKTKETVYYASAIPSNVYIGGKTGVVINKNIYYQATYRGYLSGVKVTGLPAGLRAEVHNQFVTIKGVPTAVANGTQATITAKDESGRSLTQKVLFYIGSDTQIVAYIPTEGRTILANDDYAENFEIRAYGGSGNYNYSLVNNTNKYISLSEYDDSSIRFGAYSITAGKKEYFPAGRYNVAYSVTDSINTAITASGSLAVTAVNGVKITGSVAAGDNTPIGDATVSARFKDINHTFFDDSLSESTVSEDYTDASTNQKYTKGSYELVVYPAQAYNLQASAGGASSGVVNFNPGNANQVRNFALPIYKVTFAAADVDVKEYSFDIDGVDGNGYKRTGTAETYLKKGTYMVNETTDTVVSHPDQFTTVYTTYKLTGSFTVAGNMTVNLTAVKAKETTESKINSEPLSVTGNTSVNAYDYYKFTPSENGQYAVTCDSSLQTVTVYTADGTKVGSYDAAAKEVGSAYQCIISSELKANIQYLFSFDYMDTVSVSKYVPAPAETNPPTDN